MKAIRKIAVASLGYTHLLRRLGWLIGRVKIPHGADCSWNSWRSVDNTRNWFSWSAIPEQL